MSAPRIALLHTRVRVEERLLLEALETRDACVQLVDLRARAFDLADHAPWRDFDLALDRSISLTSSLTAVRVLEAFGVRCVNTAHAIQLCADKLASSLALERAGLPTPRVVAAVGPGAALDAVEQIGYPAVIKPTVGSWGRLLARVNDRDAAQAVIEHRATLGNALHHVFYVQEHIDKPGRDLRVFVVGGEPVAAIARFSDHWVTNTARGAHATGLPLTAQLREISRRAAACTGADLVAVDLLECPRRGLVVNELNHSLEFRNSIHTTGVDIPGAIADHTLAIAEGSRPPAEVA